MEEFNVDAAIKTLNDVQAEYYVSHRESDADKFRQIYRDISNHGWRICRHRRNGTMTYSVKKCGSWVNFKPCADKRNDCTTRSIFFALEEKIPYWEIREEQNKTASNVYASMYAYRNVRCRGWNSSNVWSKVLANHGFTRIDLARKVVREKLAKMLIGCGRIVTHSSAHCAGILDGVTYDTWDSTFKKCDFLFVRNEMKEKALVALGGLAW